MIYPHNEDDAIEVFREQREHLAKVKAAVDITWKKHHNRSRNTWGWKSNHEAYRALRENLEEQLWLIDQMITELQTPIGAKFPDEGSGW